MSYSPTIEQKLDILRRRWKNEPNNRKIIELQAKILKSIKNKRFESFVARAEKIFGAKAI